MKQVCMSLSLVVITVLLAAPAMAGGVSGAIFTTDISGWFVNNNMYDSQEDVYLNGGPRPNAPCSAAGLPDGHYYFQVTDPSGSMLLSTDDITDREVVVSGGVIVALGTLGTHSFSVTGQCDSITVQLSPFDDTPNPGHEYKVWMTPVLDYACNDPLTFCGGSFGFFTSKSKTDNFKVVPADTPDGD